MTTKATRKLLSTLAEQEEWRAAVHLPASCPSGAGYQFGGGELEQATDPHYRDAQSAQWNVTIERELTANTVLRASYVGMNSYRLNVTENLNQTIPVPNHITSRMRRFRIGECSSMSPIWVAPTIRRWNWRPRTEWREGCPLTPTMPGRITSAMRRAMPDRICRGNQLWTRRPEPFRYSCDRGNVEGTRRQRLLVTGTYELPFGKGGNG